MVENGTPPVSAVCPIKFVRPDKVPSLPFTAEQFWWYGYIMIRTTAHSLPRRCTEPSLLGHARNIHIPLLPAESWMGSPGAADLELTSGDLEAQWLMQGYTWSFRALESCSWSEPLTSVSKGLNTVIYLHGLELTDNMGRELVYDTKYDFLSNMNSQPQAPNHFCSTKHCKLEYTEEANFQSNRRTKGPQIWSHPDGRVGTYSQANSPMERQQDKTYKNKQVTGSWVMCSSAIIAIIHF